MNDISLVDVKPQFETRQGETELLGAFRSFESIQQ